MIKVNSLSGGKTSSYIAANYPADYDVFALVRIEDTKCKFPDEKVRQMVEDRIGKPFIATAEDDKIIYTMLDLEQYIGRPIKWVTGVTFDEVIEKGGGTLPNVIRRFCTTQLKLNPIFDWWRETINEPSEFRIGFRANEMKRAKRTKEKTNQNGFLEMKAIVGKRGKRNKWDLIEWQKPTFPLIKDMIFKDQIEEFWKDKNVRFAPINNCVGCFHQNEILLRKQYDWHKEKLNWFASKEGVKHPNDNWRGGKDLLKYKDIFKYNLQTELFKDDFDECDSGYCGL